MRTPLRSAALVIAAALTLTGCSTLIPTASDTGSSEIDPAPTDGEAVSGTGYTIVAPEGWVEGPKTNGGFTADLVMADVNDRDGFSDNFNVLMSPMGVVTPEQVETLGVTELETAGATDVTVNDRTTVADSESSHLSASMEAQGVSYAVEQYYVSTDDQTYVVTFSFSPTVSADDRVGLAESVLVTWEWS